MRLYGWQDNKARSRIEGKCAKCADMIGRSPQVESVLRTRESE